MEEDQNGRRPKFIYLFIYIIQSMTIVSTIMEDDQNGRRPKWKTTKMEDDRNGRRPK